MDGLDSWGALAGLAISIGLSTIRLAVAFLVMPIFSGEIVPALVRNSVFAVLGFVVAVLQPIDVQAQILDPFSGHQVTLFSDFFGRFANLVFLSVGGLMLLTGVLLKSFAVWPLESLLPRIERDGVLLFADTFSGTFTLIVLLAAPALAVVFLIDAGMGLINRFAQRMNVSFLSNSIKSLVSVVLVLLMLPMLIETLVRTLDANVADTLGLVRTLFDG